MLSEGVSKALALLKFKLRNTLLETVHDFLTTAWVRPQAKVSLGD